MNQPKDSYQFAAVSPDGVIHLTSVGEGAPVAQSVSRRLQKAFAKGPGHALLHLGLAETKTPLNAGLSYWRSLGQLFLKTVCTAPESESLDQLELEPPDQELRQLAQMTPPMRGAEYVNEELLSRLWTGLEDALKDEVEAAGTTLKAFLEQRGAVWHLMGRVCFHLAENKKSPDRPFAFLATYTHALSATGDVRHLPLGNALREYAGQKKKLLSLLSPVHEATTKSKLIRELVESREIFHPQAWTPRQAHVFLKEIPLYEEAGVVVRVPNWWKAKSPPRPQVRVTVGDKRSGGAGLDALLDFSVELTLNGEKLTQTEINQILSASRGLALIRGQWVEVDREKLGELLNHWEQLEESAGEGGLSFVEGMRLLSGAGIGGVEEAGLDLQSEWTSVSAGRWLSEALQKIREPGGRLKGETKWKSVLKKRLQGELRPYQWAGVKWLRLLDELKLGACLADDMGLGKTIQVLSLLLLLKEEQGGAEPFLLVVPASLLGNWKMEAEKFAPDLRVWIAHPSGATGGQSARQALHPTAEQLKGVDAVITTYATARNLDWVKTVMWRTVILDEAQAIKNPGSQQTRAIKALNSRHRILLTGTPVENHLSDLWSLFDFLNPGLLGSLKQFQAFLKPAKKTRAEEDTAANVYAPLRKIVEPYILRRLKTDKRVISDLPDKTELQTFCGLSKAQAALYQDAVKTLAREIEEVEGIQRKGLVLAYLMRFKQICNHPSQWLGDSGFQPKDSGKFLRLKEIAETIMEKQEKLLVFTQFKEITGVLETYLAEIFGQRGLVLHGQTAVKKRKSLVARFQEASGPPFFVLSLKAGGTGLNLTAASHVVHFDRWWNPAVENQATDRAYRIGQKKNVLVHKFVCQGTIEERIDRLIKSKLDMSEQVVGGSGEAVVTEMTNKELMDMVAIDINRAVSTEA